MKISRHANERMKQRTSYNHKERKKLFRNALLYGKNINDIKGGEFKDYLKSKQNCKIKVYKDYLFIYSKNSHQLYTMYEIPDKFKKQ